MLCNTVVTFLLVLISCTYCGKASKRGGRNDAGKLVATLCHYYSDGAMGCKECFEVARSHRSNHNSTLLPPCKSVQGIKRRNWTVEDGIIHGNPVIDTNATKRMTLASCAFYANNKTFTCVATRPMSMCGNLTEIECSNNTSWSSRYEGSITEGFRCVPPGESKATTVKPNTPSVKFQHSSFKPTAASTQGSSTTDLSLTTNTTRYSLTSNHTDEFHMTSENCTTTPQLNFTTTIKSTNMSEIINSTVATTSNSNFTLNATMVHTANMSDFTENCTETSCTIFADTVKPDVLASNNQTLVFLNESLPHDHHHNDVRTILHSLNSTSSNESTLVTFLPEKSFNTTSAPKSTLVVLDSFANSTKHAYKVLLLEDEVLTPNSPTTTLTSATSSSTGNHVTENNLILFHNFNSNKTSFPPEPRKRQPLRRMY